jgi:VWFA-related protein
MHRILAVLIVPTLLGTSLAADSSSAYEILDRTIAAYRELSSYRDHGEMVVIETATESVTTKRYQFSTAADDAGSYMFRLEGQSNGTRSHAVWRRDGALWLSIDGTAKPSLSSASVFPLILGPDATPAFLVPILLLRDAEIPTSPDAAAFEGSETCGTSTCDILLLSWRQGLSLSRLWIDRETNLVLRSEVDLLPLPGPGAAQGQVRRTLAVDHRVDSLDEDLPADLFSAVEVQQAPARQQGLRTAEDFIVSDEISVALRTVPVRVLDRRGRPIRGLEAADFEVLVGKEQLPVVAADWIPAGGEAPASLQEMSPIPPAPMTPRDQIHGNLIVFFIQADFNAVRIKGHLRILPFVREFLDALEPQDWVAVVSFDSHLKLWHDFSRDRLSTGDVIERAVRFGSRPLLPLPGKRAIARSFPAAEAKRAAKPEQALYLTARSLLDIPGEKVIVYLGWGLGRFGGSGFSMTPEYERALAALQAARASVFVLDVTDADYHTLELGIRQVASDTGGTYAKTNDFARREVLRLTEAISGYYLLTLDRESLPEERRKLRIRLRDLPWEVLLRDHRLYR